MDESLHDFVKSCFSARPIVETTPVEHITTGLFMRLFESVDALEASKLFEAETKQFKVKFKYPPDPNEPDVLTDLKCLDGEGNEVDELMVNDGAKVPDSSIPAVPNIAGWNRDDDTPWEFVDSDGNSIDDGTASFSEVRRDFTAVAVFEPEDAESDLERFTQRLIHDGKHYVSDLKKTKLNDDRQFARVRFNRDFQIDRLSFRAGDRINAETWFNILDACVKVRDEGRSRNSCRPR